MSLREEQIRRYARHILLPDIGGIGQARLLDGAVRVVVGPARPGASVALAYLAAAGVGTLVIADEDGKPVAEREVAGTILLGTEDIGRDRFEALRARLVALNPDVSVLGELSDAKDAFDVRVEAEPELADVAGSLVAGGTAAVRALVSLAGQP